MRKHSINFTDDKVVESVRLIYPQLKVLYDNYASLISLIDNSDNLSSFDHDDFVAVEEPGSSPWGTSLSIPIDTPVNAVAAGFEATIVARPADYVANVQSSKTITVASQPRVNVQATGTITVTGTPALTYTQATGTITITDTPVAEETFVIGDETYTFKAAANSAFEVTIDANNTTQAENIVTTITADSTYVDADNTDGVVTITAKTAYLAELGNDIDLTESATGVAVSGAKLAGGLTEAEETLNVGEHEFTFVALRSQPGEITISSDNNTQASNIATALLDMVDDVTALASTNTVVVTAVVAGTAGNALALTESAAGIAVSGSGTLAGGVDADTIVVDTKTYTFIANGETPADDEISIGTTTSLTAESIAHIVDADADITTLTADHSSNTVIFTAVAAGTSGDGITITADDTRITGDGDTAGGVDEVRNYLTINVINYTFCETGGADPTVAYPTDVKVATAAGATTTQVATALVAALKTDTSIFSNTSVSNEDNVITANHKTKGTLGNDTTYVNNLGTPGNITVTGITGGKFTGGVNGTPGTAGDTFFESGSLWICNTTNETSTNDNWLEFTPGR